MQNDSSYSHSSYNGALNNQTLILRRIAAEVMEVRNIAPVPSQTPGSLEIHGQLRSDPDTAYDYLSKQFGNIGYTALLRHAPNEKDGVVLLIFPGKLETGQARKRTAIILFVLTIISTIFVGGHGLEMLILAISAAIEGGSVASAVSTFDLGIGLAFSAAILSILGAHEMGHFLVARRLRVAVSYPYFIPLPFSPIGTMGAFISMKEPPPNRRSLLAIAIAGPLAGLVVAIPVLLMGLNLSVVEPPPDTPYLLEGNSLLYATLKWLMFGQFLPSETLDVSLHPVAFAGWVGLLVTALNLIPAGQLDGGHILYALVGPDLAQKATWAIAMLLLLMGAVFGWFGWFVWAALIILLGRFRVPLFNEVSPLNRQQQVLAILGLVIFVLVFTPTPFTEMP
jgi:membrane-associated protease RseP (regulator of RpoE activity)